MYKPKTKETDRDVLEFIESVEHPGKRRDALQLLTIFKETTGYSAKMWGPSIIGFGSYHYKYASGHEGAAPLVGFSPRKSKISLYFATGDPEREELLQQFGKHTAGKGCVYINKIEDIRIEILEALIRQSVDFLRKTYSQEPTEKRESAN
ncbi:DUF1801 domain-containing protein [Paenibacillus sp. alder61]|uniref:DUF1801 domain-containing protein n=1 Tax=Paenibacillus faecis TaxID=862114 RepID=A0A5D0CLM1_9BACL|nr:MULTISPECIES: DUF1801 domain-containing protein [Paenibacillus]MCA1296088.1 DUF1801 domain-containing protein [Paenibacillus sp. alder61]TYA10909.1 DUF1801 domain-containing protein [Paenibacillus faecis]